MEGISDIRIIGMDAKRPPKIRKEPYIDLIFQLAHKAPVDWCHDFVGSQANMQYKSTINTEDCLFIETWVRTPDEIAGHLQTLKTLVAECNARYIEKAQAIDRDREGNNNKLQNEAGSQGQLNRLIAGLDFGE